VFTPELRNRIRLVALGAIWGFLAGVIVVTAVVWKAERSETWLGSGTRFLANRLPGVEPWDRGPVDDYSPVLET
jgi:hypothetical protein